MQQFHTPPSTGLTVLGFQSNQNGPKDPKGNKNIICTMGKNGETDVLQPPQGT